MLVKSSGWALVACVSLQSAVAAQNVTHKAILDLSSAKQLACAAQHTATTKGWPGALEIVDDGTPIVAGIERAQDKAPPQMVRP